MTPAIRAPRLGQGFWGEGGIERVHTGAGLASPGPVDCGDNRRHSQR